MKIDNIIWQREIVDKLLIKHQVETDEVEQVLDNRPKIRLVEKGHRAGEEVYMASGQTDEGRTLIVLYIYKQTHEALILSARDMVDRERKRYDKK